ncbi:hypothetical protein DDE82_004107 [Stemphylium lycopersici]|uniref:Uncharacterized protein n=1 Tax=Stemphylium lycopersici TaxID=183478 RepID=A0A364NG25_STELY|nr:hypothetical protein DDE82_004107 [Stemphylium lycopersici]RAR16285.1 hypothetical protein DDE83_000413 [Stemphylium lycopersici]
MLGTSSDGLITKLATYLTPDKSVAPGASPPTSSGDAGSYSPFLSPTNDEARNEASRITATNREKAVPRRSLKRSVSELVIPSQVRNERLTATAALNAIRFKDDERHLDHSAHPNARWSIGSSQTVLRSASHDPTTSSTSLERQLGEVPISSNELSHRHGQLRRRPTVDDPLTRTRPVPTRSTPVRSSSNPNLAKAFANPRTREHELPLKPCIKNKAKSATTASPGGIVQDTTDVERRILRRVKTVDFEESGSRTSILLPRVDVTLESATDSPMHAAKTISVPTRNPGKAVKKSPSCPNTISIVKSSVADQAVTRTDNAQDVTNDDVPDPATPTMQIIETKSGSYEVIWDDVPSEYSIRMRDRRSSSASHSLETVSPGAGRGLERVNSKLAGWAGTWNSPSDCFRPTIVVFPDDDGRAKRYDCAVEDEDEEDLTLLVPPNSQMTSATSSNHVSRPTSAPLTRTVSREGISLRTALHETQPQVSHDMLQPPEQSLVVPSPDIQLGGGKAKQAIMVRQLSNLEEADMRFCRHRDSVTIAHSRLVHSGKVSPEPFERRDSVAIARKRMHNRNQAERVQNRTKRLSAEDLNHLMSGGIPEVTLPAIKARARQALEKGESPLIRRPSQGATDQRHIRIVEAAVVMVEFRPYRSSHDVSIMESATTDPSKRDQRYDALRNADDHSDSTLLLVIVGLLGERRWRSHVKSHQYELAGDITGFAPTFSQQIINFKPSSLFAPEDATEFWSNETQHAWLSIVPGYVNVKSPSEYSNLPHPIHDYPNQTVFTTSVTHQLHCLYTILEAYNSMKLTMASPVSVNPVKMPWHVNHCFEYIRQAIMCAGDVALEGAATSFPGDAHGEDRGGSDGWDAKHVCKDYGQVYEYLEKETINHMKWISSE